ncbi:hypothetical protein [Escherichia coli]|uniref:hypothetical protein n=1 Tax=Escherichia coli TaxID=562 RepID=UPI0035B65B7D
MGFMIMRLQFAGWCWLPAFKVKLYIAAGTSCASVMASSAWSVFINSYVKGRYLTPRSATGGEFSNNDPLITRAIAVNILLDLYRV